MVKIAFIGAGSKGFAQAVVGDCLSFSALRKNTIVSLMDINQPRLEYAFKLLNLYKEDHPELLKNVEFEMTDDQREAITDAKYIIAAFMVGGWEAYKQDVDIPFKYNVTQNVGDTLGPGGVFRFLRSAPVYEQIIKNMREVGYNAGVKGGARPLFINYTNPMIMNTWFCNKLWLDSTVGLCHGVQGTSDYLRMLAGASPDEFTFNGAGINHMFWFTELWFKDYTQKDAKWQDAYPIIWEHYKDEPEIAGSEKVRWDMFKATGYFMTESSGHLSEYLPYYRKRQDLLDKYKGSEEGFSSLRHAVDMENFTKGSLAREELVVQEEPPHLAFKDKPSREYASNIINAMESDVPFKFFGNVINKKGGLVTNLPADCCVEVPIFADYHGLHPQGGIELPTVCQALNTSNIMVQKAAVEGALARDKEKVYHAVLLDPNTASVCSPEEIRDMVGELFETNARWLDYFEH
ncbi:MAG TPA: alpha-glucosidase/alpha-galactosidase [Candidatus Lokiarchaeia archaeon]|nr:alpha-glucosidase/alpha-galactosidase [Candidatus Lokiarchaeia archaeon]